MSRVTRSGVLLFALAFAVAPLNGQVAPTLKGHSARSGTGFRLLRDISSSSIRYAVRIVLSDSVSFSQWWQLAKNDPHFDTTSAPLVDFSKQMVVLIGMGEGGLVDLRVTAVDSTGGVLRIHVAMSAPENGCNFPADVAAPVQIIEVPKTIRPLVFADSFSRFRCAQKISHP